MFRAIAGWIASAIEAAGILVLVIGAVASSLTFVRDGRRHTYGEAYNRFRRDLGRAVLLSLEFLVAADIVGTVVVDPTFANLGVLAFIVVIRTGLSFALEVEITGRWPWGKQEPARPDATPTAEKEASPAHTSAANPVAAQTHEPAARVGSPSQARGLPSARQVVEGAVGAGRSTADARCESEDERRHVMPMLELPTRDLALLREILAEYHDQLLLEIANTDARAFRDELRHREDLVREIFERVTTLIPAVVAKPAVTGAVHTR